jgi:hypothetical protein
MGLQNVKLVGRLPKVETFMNDNDSNNGITITPISITALTAQQPGLR